MAVNVEIDENIFKRVKNKMNNSFSSPSQLINQFLLESLDDVEGANIVTSYQDIQNLLAHDKPEGDNSLEGLNGVIDRGFVTDSVDLKRQTYR